MLRNDKTSLRVVDDDAGEFYVYRGFIKDARLTQGRIDYSDIIKLNKYFQNISGIKDSYLDSSYLYDIISDASTKVLSNSHLFFHHIGAVVGGLQMSPTESYVTKRSLMYNLQEKKQESDIAIHSNGILDIGDIEVSDYGQATALQYKKRNKWIATGIGESDNTYVYIITRQTPDEIQSQGGIDLDHALLFTNENTAMRYYSGLHKIESSDLVFPVCNLQISEDFLNSKKNSVNEAEKYINDIINIINKCIKGLHQSGIIEDKNNFIKSFMNILIEIKNDLRNLRDHISDESLGKDLINRLFNRLVNNMNLFLTDIYVPLMIKNISHPLLSSLDAMFTRFAFQMIHGMGKHKVERVASPSTPLNENKSMEKPSVPAKKAKPSKPLDRLDDSTECLEDSSNNRRTRSRKG